MNILPIAASFVRSVTRRIADGALPPHARLDEWAIYQHDLEMTRLLTEASGKRPDVTFSVLDGSKAQVVPK